MTDLKQKLAIWKPIKNFENYQVSNLGSVRGPRGLLKPCKGPGGYPSVGLTNKGAKRTTRVHRLVLETFCGPPPEGMECAHLDGTRTNNRLENLKWCTRQENISHKYLHGTILEGSQHHMHKLTDEQVRRIPERMRAGELIPSIAKEYGVTENALRRIVNGSGWKTIETKKMQSIDVPWKVTKQACYDDVVFDFINACHRAGLEWVSPSMIAKKVRGPKYLAPWAGVRLRRLRAKGLVVRNISGHYKSTTVTERMR